MIEKMRINLTSWGSRFLNLSGKVVILRAVVSSIPLYHMEFFQDIGGVVGDMEKLMCAFLWGRIGGGRRVP